MLPQSDGALLREEARSQIAIAAVRQRELPVVLEALHREGVDVVLIKGAHLAGSVYAEPCLRPRADTDLLIRAWERDRAVAALAGIGYSRQPIQTGETVLGQILFDREGTVGGALDVHVRIARPHLAAALFDVDELLSRAVALPRMGSRARGLSLPDALALACVHRVAHHATHDLLLWTYDVHLLIRAFSPEDLEAFTALAIGRRMTALCRFAIARSARAFPDPSAAEILRRLGAADPAEPSAALLGRRGGLDDLRMDLRAIPGWRARTALIAGHLLPPAAYMRTKYPRSSRAALPWLYVRRVLEGAMKNRS